MEAAKDPDDPEPARLVGGLSVQEPDFRTWWAEHHVNTASYGTKHYQHPTVGDLTLDCDTWDSADGSGQRLMVRTAEPGSPSHDALRILTSWAAGDAEARAFVPRVVHVDAGNHVLGTGADPAEPVPDAATVRGDAVRTG